MRLSSHDSGWRIPGVLAFILVALVPAAVGHEHHADAIPDGQTISDDPMDTVLWIHIVIQMLAFGVLFPLGMVLGLVKNRWHVPLQVVSTLISVLGYALGHMHGGRQFVAKNAHAQFADILYLFLFAQVIFGVYLKLHLEKGFHGRIRPTVRFLHSLNGKVFPIMSWTQMIFGGITTLGFCQGDHLGQCLAHFIMGSAFLFHGAISTVLLLVGQLWIRRVGRSQEFFESCLIAAWGCVNTFTEHRWGHPWVRNDWQHTTMGIVWWCAGLAGIWLSKDRDGQPRRHFIPGLVILVTGWAMSAHPQDLPISAMTHKMFGYTLMAAGVARIIEVTFIVKDKHGLSENGRETSSFQYLTVLFLYASGFLFMGATEEQMNLVAHSGLDHVSYILILYSLAAILFLFVALLVSLYDKLANPIPVDPSSRNRLGVHQRTASAQVRDAEEFELDGLISDEEDEEAATRRKLLRDDLEESGLASPSTVGRNSDRVAP